MLNNYFKPQDKETGYLSVLKNFRTEIPLATNKHCKNLDFIVEGNLPEEIIEYFPIFGLPSFLESDFYALNSGGRGILLSNGKTHLRFKGCDVNGSITTAVGRSKKNLIADIALAARAIENLEFDTIALNSGRICQLPSYQGKPFSFFTKESIEKERHASDVIGLAFEKKGFLKPYSVNSVITYPSIQWNEEPCSTIVFDLPSIESDLRFGEFFRHAFLHLKFASPKELIDIKDDFNNFLEKLTTWYGFVTSVMEENHLAPTINSHQHQNYVISHVSETEIGASRVDHTSTVIDEDKSSDYSRELQKQLTFFGDTGIFLLHALGLIEQGYHFDENRYTGYFDRAYKWHEPINLDSFPEMKTYFQKLNNAFVQGFKNKDPIPTPQKDLVDIVTRLSKIRMDEKLQLKIHNLLLKNNVII